MRHIRHICISTLPVISLLGQGQSSVHGDEVCVYFSDFSCRSKRGACAAAAPERRASCGAGRHAGRRGRSDQVRKPLFFFFYYIWLTICPIPLY